MKLHQPLILTLVAVVLASGSNAAMSAGARPVVDNERVTVWDYSLDKGHSGLTTPHDLDAVIMYLEGGRIRTVDASGKSSVETRKFGDAVFVPKGTDATDTVVSGGPVFEVIIALKDHAAPAFSATSTYPSAFPRPGSVIALDNPRFRVWHYDWKIGVPTAMHIHDKDFVVVFRYNAEQKIVRPDGEVRTATVNAGETIFLERGLTHSEEFPNDPQSGLFLELK